MVSCPDSRSFRPEAAKACASWRAPCTGSGPIAATSPARVAATWMLMPAYPALPEYRSGMAFQSQVGAMVPSASRVPFFPAIWAGASTQSASTWPMTGRSRSHLRDTVGWEQPKTAPAASWVRFLRISVTTIATDLNRPIAAGAPPRQLCQLPVAQPCESLVPQRLLHEFRSFAIAVFMAGAVLSCEHRHVKLWLLQQFLKPPGPAARNTIQPVT